MKYLKYLLPIVFLALAAGGANIDLRSLRTGDFGTNSGYVTTTTWTNNNGQMMLKTNVPIYVDYLTGGPVGTGAEFDIDPISGTAATNPNTYALVGFNGNPPLGAAGVENNGSGQIGVAGGALAYGSNTNGAVAGVLGITERAHTTGIGVVGTSFGQAGTTNVGVVGSAQGGDNLVGGYFETASAKSTASRGYGGSVLIADARDTTNFLFFGRTNGATTYKVRSDGSVFRGKNAGQDVNFNDYGTFYDWTITMTDSNEPNISYFGLGNIDNESSYIGGQLLFTAAQSTRLANLTLWSYGGGTRSLVLESSASGTSIRGTDWAFQDLGVFELNNVSYAAPSAHGAAGSVLKDTDGSGTLSWAAAGVSVAGGTNITAVTNGNLVTISVTSTNLPAVAPGNGISITTNGLLYTVALTVTNFATASSNTVLTNILNSLILTSINANARIGPGTNNFLAKFNVVGGTNVGNSPLLSEYSNSVVLMSRQDAGTLTNSATNALYGEWTSANNWQRLEMVVAKGHGNEANHLRSVVGSGGPTDGNWPLDLQDSWSIESASPVSGHAAGALYPLADNLYRIGSSSSRVKGNTVGTGNIVVGNSSSQPSLLVGSDAVFDGDPNSLSFWRPTTGITAAFDRFNNLFLLDLSANSIGWGSSMSNCVSFIGPSTIAGLVQVGTNSGSATPTSVGLMGGQAAGTDKGGSDMRIIGGPSTGTGTNGNVRLQTAEKALASSSSLNSSFKDRVFIIADPIILTTNAATVVFNMTIPTALKGAGGTVFAHTEIEDGVNMATLDENFVISANRKGSTVVAGTPSAPIGSPSTSGGSAAIANTWTLVANAQSVDLKLTCVTSGILSTNSTVRVTFLPNSSAVPVITHP